MIFQHTWEKVLDGTKTQTRRLVKPGDWAMNEWIQIPEDTRDGIVGGVAVVRSKTGGIRWIKGRDYAVQPGRGQKAVGRILITGIRRERVNDISEDDAVAEGCEWDGYWTPGGMYEQPEWIGNYTPDDYADLWDIIHTKPGETWADNPLVWVLEFELAR